MEPRKLTVIGLVLLVVILALQIVSYVHLGGEFTGRPGAVGEEEYLDQLRIRLDRDEHQGYIAGSILGLIALTGLLRTRSEPARRALIWATVPVAFSASSWLGWAIPNFAARDYLVASPIGGLLGILGALSGLAGPIVCGCILAKGRDEGDAIPQETGARIGIFVFVVFLWTLFFMSRAFKYMFAV